MADRDQIQTLETEEGFCSTDDYFNRPTVVLAVDDSEHSLYAMDWYVRYIHKPENVIVLVHVPEKEDLANWGPKEEKKARQLEDKYLHKMIKEGLHGKVRVTIGKAGDALIKTAIEEDAILIVTGTRGMGAIKRAFVSSFSDYLVHNSPIPVLVCRRKGHGPLEK